MRFRTFVLALALASGIAAVASAANPAKRPVIHRTAKKGTVRKSKSKLAKSRKAKRGKTVKSFH